MNIERPGHHQFAVATESYNAYKFQRAIDTKLNQGKNPLNVILVELLRMKERLFFDKELEFDAILEELKNEKDQTAANLVAVAAKKIAEFSKANYDLAELEKRSQERIPDFKIRLSNIISCDFAGSDPNRVKIHLAASSTFTLAEKLKGLRDGLKELARLMETDPRFMKSTSVYAKSWIVREQPGIFEKIGFVLMEENENDRVSKQRRAQISREDFLKKFKEKTLE